VKSVEEPSLPELDEEFCQSFGVSEGGVPRLREDVAANMRRELEQALRNRNKSAVMEKLYQTNPIDVPNALLESQIRDTLSAVNTSSSIRRARTRGSMRWSAPTEMRRL
jgi:trigger factor